MKRRRKGKKGEKEGSFSRHYTFDFTQRKGSARRDKIFSKLGRYERKKREKEE
jgi:hypothetical protein